MKITTILHNDSLQINIFLLPESVSKGTAFKAKKGHKGRKAGKYQCP